MFIYEFFAFLFAIVTLFYLPGTFLLKKLKLQTNLLENLFLSTTFGIVVFTILEYAFSWLKVDILALVFIVIIDVITIKNKLFLNHKWEKKDKWSVILILIFSLIFATPMITSGYFSTGLRLLGVNNIDGLWHLALINELKVNFPPFHPGFSGVPLTGYHFFFFFLLAKISNIFNISHVNLLYRFFPLLLSLLWGIGVYTLIFAWSKKRAAALWAVFLTMFGGSFVYLSHFEGHRELSLNSGYGILQPSVSMLNPPFAISIVILIAFLFSMFSYLTSRKSAWLLLMVIFAGVVAMFKVYAGMIIFGGFAVFILFELFKKNYRVLLAGIATCMIFLLTYWPFSDKSAHLIFYPLWAPHSVLASFPWYGYEEKMYTYTRQGVIRGLIETEFYAFYIFFIGNLGTRIIGLFVFPIQFIKNKKLPSTFSFIVFCMACGSIIVPLFFIQTGKVFEIIQLAWYFLFLISLLSALGFAFFFELKFPKPLKAVIFLFIIIATVPSAIPDYRYYILTSGGFINGPGYDAMTFLSKIGSYNQPVVKMPDYNLDLTSKELTRWYNEQSLSMVAFGNKSGFLNNENITFKEAKVEDRLKFIKGVMEDEKKYRKNKAKHKDLPEQVTDRLKDKKIVYIYSHNPMTIFNSSKRVKNIYNKDKIYIYEIN